jgi:hypothetical protein
VLESFTGEGCKTYFPFEFQPDFAALILKAPQGLLAPQAKSRSLNLFEGEAIG